VRVTAVHVAVGVFVAAEVIAIGVERTSFGTVVVLSMLLLAGLGCISEGLTLTPQGHDQKPEFGEGYVWLWIAHRLPLRLASAWYVLWGLALLAVVGHGLWVHRP